MRDECRQPIYPNSSILENPVRHVCVEVFLDHRCERVFHTTNCFLRIKLPILNYKEKYQTFLSIVDFETQFLLLPLSVFLFHSPFLFPLSSCSCRLRVISERLQPIAHHIGYLKIPFYQGWSGIPVPQMLKFHFDHPFSILTFFEK